MHTDEQLLELTGNETIEDLDEWFGGKSYDYILSEVNRCWPHEDNNAEFAQELFERFGNE